MSAREMVMTSVMLGVLAACGGGATSSGSGADAGDVSGTGSVQAYKLSGKATDTHGAPIPGANLQICNPLFFDSCMTGATAADGKYSFDLPPANVWNANASISKIFNGRTYCLDLMPDVATTFSSTDGAIRNFSWKIIGLRPDATAANQYTSYYGAGANITPGDFNNEVPVNDVVMHFVPVGPLVDGSAGQAFTANARDWVWNIIGNIPLGRYTVTAEYAPAGGAKLALLVGTTFMQYAASATLDFDPASSSSCVGPIEGKVYVAFP